MRLLFVTSDLVGARGGGNRFSEELLLAFLHRGHEVCAVVHEVNPAVGIKQIALLETHLRYMANPLLALHSAIKLQKTIREFKPDVVHVLCEPYASMLPFMHCAMPVVLTVHGTYAYIPHLLTSPLRRMVSAALFHTAYKKATGIAPVSRYTETWLHDQHLKRGIDLSGKTKVISGGIRSPEHVPPTAQTGETGEKTTKLLFVGGVKARKGVAELLEMIAAYRLRFHKDVQLNVVGGLKQEAEYVERVKRRASAPDLNGCVVWEGEISDTELASRYGHADALVMLSRPAGIEFEGFGLVYLEANSYGVPVIGAYGAGAEEAISNGESGYLVHCDSPDEGAAALNTLLNDRESLSQGAFAWARSHTWGSVAQKYEEYYQTLRRM